MSCCSHSVRDDGKEQFSRRALERRTAHLIEDEQLGADDSVHQGPYPARTVSYQELAGQLSRPVENDLSALQAGLTGSKSCASRVLVSGKAACLLNRLVRLTRRCSTIDSSTPVKYCRRFSNKKGTSGCEEMTLFR